MAVIYLRHAVHGEKVATLDMEAEYDERNGWVRFTLEDEAPASAPARRPRRVAAPEGDE